MVGSHLFQVMSGTKRLAGPGEDDGADLGVRLELLERERSGLGQYVEVPEVGIGLLAMASEDAQRFYPEMGTLYLQRLGETVAAALQRFVA